jgi:digeranylgeranylglycerophospholipid reductase
MKTVSDVIVVGGGPCGSFAALNLAKHGVDVTVFEEHGGIGVPCHCAGHLSIRGLKNLGLHPLPSEVVENTFYGANFYSPKGREFSVRFPQPVTCVVSRALFDERVARVAERAGARYCLNTRVESLIVEKGFVKGVNAKQNGEVCKDFAAKIVVDAEGISSRLLRQAGLQPFNRDMLVNAVEAEVENVKDMEPDTVEVFLGREYAPGFYAWLIPKRDGEAKVGLAAKNGNPKELLRRLMLKHPVASKKLRSAKVLRTAFHPITLGGPIPKTHSNGFLAVGDVASQVKPTTGGGVIFGMTCARVAADAVCEALRRDDFSSESLSAYQRRCGEISGFDVRAMLRIRKMLNAMSDQRVDDIIGFCTRLGIDKTLQNVKDVDFQGQALLRILPSPRMLPALFYLFFLYISANP